MFIHLKIAVLAVALFFSCCGSGGSGSKDDGGVDGNEVQDGDVTSSDEDGDEQYDRGDSIGDSVGDAGDGDSVRAIIESCFVESLHIGVMHSVQCYASDPLGRTTDGQWIVASDIPGLVVGSTGRLETQRPLDASDEGEHEYTVHVLDSDGYTFTVPVDEHKSTLLIKCPDENEVELLFPERIVDYLAILCGQGFLVDDKPGTSADPDYILDVEQSCIPGIIESLSDARKEMLTHYEDATLLDEIYSRCTPETAKVKYHHD